jgi:hypothetical protein
MPIRTIPFVLCLLLLTSCASIVSRSRFHVPIDSVPQGAVVAYDGANVGVTPCTVVMQRKCSMVTLTRDGYHDQIVEVGRGMNGWILGNLIFGGGIGVVVDAASGATGTISEAPCWVELTPSTDPQPAVWVRPTLPEARDEDGWIAEGQTEARVAEKPKPRASRAPAATAEDLLAIRRMHEKAAQPAPAQTSASDY